MSNVRITLARSPIGSGAVQRRTLYALGLRKIGQSVERPDRPEIRGMIGRVEHLVVVEPLAEEGSP